MEKELINILKQFNKMNRVIINFFNQLNFNKMNRVSKLIAIAIAVTFATSCDKDDPVQPQLGGALICTTVPSPDGTTGSAYMQLIPDLKKASYDNSNAIPTTYNIPPITAGNNVFDLPATSAESNTITKYAFENNKLVKKGSMVAPENSLPIDIVTKGNKGYVALRGTGKIWVINHETMTEIKTIDLTAYGINDNNPDPNCLIIRDNLLFVALPQFQGYMPNASRPAVDIAIIDLNTDKPIKMITDNTSGFTWPSAGTDQHSLFMDEDKNIYIVCMGTFGMFKSGLLRIKNGETEFDKSYQFAMNKTNIEGEANQMNYLSSIVYYKNNKAYGIANIPAYFANPKKPDYFNDRFSMPVEIDLNAKTIKALGLPRSNGYGTVAGIYDEQIVFGLATDTENGYFTYQPTSGKGSKKAVVSVTGYPYKFYQFK